MTFSLVLENGRLKLSLRSLVIVNEPPVTPGSNQARPAKRCQESSSGSVDAADIATRKIALE
jgi:hypothetical protein